MKMTVFWVVGPGTQGVGYRHGPAEGGSHHLRNVGKLLPDYTAQQPRRQPSYFFVFTNEISTL
jgi:hypothetical protein